MLLPDGLRLSPRSAILSTTAFLLCFAGSSIYLIHPLRPFHWGVGLIAVLFALDGNWRRTLQHTHSRILIPCAATLVLVSSLWAIDLGRYANYATFLAVGTLYMVLGETMVRRDIPFERWLFPLALYWFATAFFPIFDTWTNATLFRDSLPITGGVWYNINDMATALVFACLIWLLRRHRLPLLLFSASWIYAIGLNRRADVLALSILGLAYLVGVLRTTPSRLRFAFAWGLATAAGMAMHGGTFYLGAMPSLVQEQPISTCTPVAADAVPLGMIAAQCVHPPPSVGSLPTEEASPPVPVTPSPASTAASTAPATAPANTHAPVPRAAASPAAVNPDPMPVVPDQARPSPVAVTDVVAHDGDVSSAIRSKILYEMYETAKTMPWWQWLTGQGVGQLNLKWPLNDRPWASPHFFWLEMFFFFGLPWIAFVGWLLWRADGYGRLALIVACVAGIAPSSLVYFQPFWFLLGVVLATLPERAGGLDSRS